MNRPESTVFLIPLTCLALLILFFPFHVVNWAFTDKTDYECISRCVIKYSWRMEFVYTNLFFDRVLCVELWDKEGDTPPGVPNYGDNIEDQNGVDNNRVGLFHRHNQHYPSCPFKLDITSHDQT